MTEHPKEHGLLFKPDMVRAYLAGVKSQTRRVITRRNSYVDGWPAGKELWGQLRFDRAWVDPGPSPAGNAGPYLKVPRPWIEGGKQVDESVHRVYPRYQVGDTIWGRETWATGRGYDGVPPRDLPNPSKSGFRINMAYRSSPETDWEGRGTWRPSIFMPRWAARIVTPIVAVRPERVQDISEEDARSEGVADEVYCENHCAWRGCEDDLVSDPDGDYPHCPECDSNSAILDELPERVFRRLWESINGKKYPWSSNPLVWAIMFKAYEK